MTTIAASLAHKEIAADSKCSSDDSFCNGKYDVSLMFFGYAVAQAAVYMMATKE